MRFNRWIAAALVAGAVATGLGAAEPVDRWYDPLQDDAHARQSALTIASLRSRGDADALLVRVMLGAFDPTDRAEDPAELVARALRADDADALVLYRLLSVPRAEVPQALRDEATRRLLSIDADNLAVALLAIPEDEAGFDEWLRSATATTRFDAYYEQTIVLLTDAAMAAPLADGFVESVAVDLGNRELDAEAAHGVAAMGVAAALAMPSLQPMFQRCDPTRDTAWSPQREAGCLQLARTLSTKGRTLMDRLTGLGLELKLVERYPDRVDAVRNAKRQLQWQQFAWLKVSTERGDADLVRSMLEHYRRGLGEFDAQRALLELAGLPLEPPVDWDVSDASWSAALPHSAAWRTMLAVDEQVFATLELRDDAAALLLRALRRVRDVPAPATADARESVHPAAIDAGRLGFAATQAADADAAVLYRVAATPAFALTADQRDAVMRRLRAIDGDNLAARLLEVDLIDVTATADAFDRWLASAASVGRADSYQTYAMARLGREFGRVGNVDDAELVDAAGVLLGEAVADAAVARMVAASMSHAVDIETRFPRLLVEQCDPGRAERWRASRGQHCLSIARTLVNTADSFALAHLGLDIWHRLVGGMPDEAAVIDARRTLHWQAVASERALLQLGPTRALSEVARALSEGLGELATKRRILHLAGVALTPPQGWGAEDAERLDAPR